MRRVAECLKYTLTLDPDAMYDVRRRAVEARRDEGPCWWNPDPTL